jgi:hypothetical protein
MFSFFQRKVAFCFIISYDHIVNKEQLWKNWIEPNADIINVYFHYKDKNKIKSPWIIKHCIPEKYIMQTSYYHMVPAYLSLLSFSSKHDFTNTWFCLLTESCVPIISPQHFRNLFLKHNEKSIFKWDNAWWNVNLHKRANLHILPKDLRLGNVPWFILCRQDVSVILQYCKLKANILKLICDGGLANESLFAIVLKLTGRIYNVYNENSTLANWKNMSSSTSPYVFSMGNSIEINFIEEGLKQHKYAIFLRKVDKKFPDSVLINYCGQITNESIPNNDFLFYLEKVIWCFYFIFYFLIIYGIYIGILYYCAF